MLVLTYIKMTSFVYFTSTYTNVSKISFLLPCERTIEPVIIVGLYWANSCLDKIELALSQNVLLFNENNMVHARRGGGGGGTRLSFGRGCRWGVKTLTLSETARRTKNTPYRLSQYTILKTFICILYPVLVRTDSLFCCVSSYIQSVCVPHAPSLVPRSWACHKHCGLGSNPVINGVVRH